MQDTIIAGNEMEGQYSHQLMIAISFGLTSGTITALGMIVGLYSATSSRLAVVAGIVVMAIADGLADAIGMHTVEEAESEKGRAKHDVKEIWITTLFTFFSVSGFILTFVVPILVFPLKTAVFIDIAWGMLLLIILNFFIARIRKESPVKTISEHVLSALAVIVVSYYAGVLIAMNF